MTSNWIETIVLDVAPLVAKERQKRVHSFFEKPQAQNKSVHKTHCLHTPWNIWRQCSFFFFLGLQRWCALRAVTTSGFRPNTFSSVCLEIIGPGSIGVYLSRLRSSQTFVTLSSTISRDTHFAWNTLGMPSLPPPPPRQNTFMVLNSCSYFHVFHNSPPVSLSAALSCSTFLFPVLFASVMHVWARVWAPRSRGQANSILLYLFLNPITQSDWDCPSVNGMGILREIVVSNNKPTCREDFQSVKVEQDDSSGMYYFLFLFFLRWYDHITIPLCYIWLSSFSTHTLIDYAAAT